MMHRFLRFGIGLLFFVGFYLLLCQISSFPAFQEIENKGLDASPLFYTESEAAGKAEEALKEKFND